MGEVDARAEDPLTRVPGVVDQPAAHHADLDLGIEQDQVHGPLRRREREAVLGVEVTGVAELEDPDAAAPRDVRESEVDVAGRPQLVEPAPRPRGRGAARRASGDRHVDLGTAHVARRGNVGIVELRNPRHLNAEDDTTLGPMEAAIDLSCSTPRSRSACCAAASSSTRATPAGAIFGAGLNLTAPLPRPDLLPVLPASATSASSTRSSAAEPAGVEKLWIAGRGEVRDRRRLPAPAVVDHILASAARG